METTTTNNPEDFIRARWAEEDAEILASMSAAIIVAEERKAQQERDWDDAGDFPEDIG